MCGHFTESFVRRKPSYILFLSRDQKQNTPLLIKTLERALPDAASYARLPRHSRDHVMRSKNIGAVHYFTESNFTFANHRLDEKNQNYCRPFSGSYMYTHIMFFQNIYICSQFSPYDA